MPVPPSASCQVDHTAQEVIVHFAGHFRSALAPWYGVSGTSLRRIKNGTGGVALFERRLKVCTVTGGVTLV